MLRSVRTRRPEEGPATTVGAARDLAFQHLGRQAHRLRWFFMVLVVVVALVPAAAFIAMEAWHLRLDADREAEQVALILTSQLEQSGLDFPLVVAKITAEMEVHGLMFVRLAGRDGGRSVEIGPRGPVLVPVRVVRSLTSPTVPFSTLEVQADDASLVHRAVRVLGIHLLVAVLLAWVAYHVPLRALQLAIEEAKGTYAQLLHSDKLSAIGEMYAGLAHEINNPLGIILSRVRFQLGRARDVELPPEMVRDLELIDRHGSRIAEIIRSLLAFARRTSFEVRDADLNAIVRDAVALVERPFAKGNIRVESRLDPTLPVVRASPDHLQQVFVNLLTNARDAMPSGGTITLRTHRNGDGVVAEVQDTGTGIAPEAIGHIFDPFFTTKDVGKGTGLGLSVSYGIVRAHGGDIQVESRPGRGALFRVSLPVEGGGR